MKKLIYLLLIIVIFSNCSKKSSNYPLPNKALEINSADINNNPVELTGLEKLEYFNMLSSFGLLDSIDTINIKKYEIYLDTLPTNSYLILGVFINQAENYKKTINVLQKESDIKSVTANTVEFSILSANRSLITITDLTTGWGEMFDKVNGKEVTIEEIIGVGNKPTFWGCMEDEVVSFTSTIQGIIALGLYPEAIFGMFAAKCAYLSW